MIFEGIKFREIPGFPNYYASKCGKILSTSYTSVPKVKKVEMAENGYLRCSLRTNLRNVKRPVHRLVALTWIGPPPEGKDQINHKNGKKDDNNVQNLEWVSFAENQRHWRKYLHEQVRGEKQHLAKLKESDVPRIREAAKVLSDRELARAFRVNRTTIARVLKKETWHHL